MSQGTRQEANAAFAGLGTPSTFRSMYDGEEGAVSLFAEPEEQRELLEGMEGTTVQEKLVDADFFNRFDDDFDEADMQVAQ